LSERPRRQAEHPSGRRERCRLRRGSEHRPRFAGQHVARTGMGRGPRSRRVGRPRNGAESTPSAVRSRSASHHPARTACSRRHCLLRALRRPRPLRSVSQLDKLGSLVRGQYRPLEKGRRCGSFVCSRGRCAVPRVRGCQMAAFARRTRTAGRLGRRVPSRPAASSSSTRRGRPTARRVGDLEAERRPRQTRPE
jgi:hypothetical protein